MLRRVSFGRPGLEDRYLDEGEFSFKNISLASGGDASGVGMT